MELVNYRIILVDLSVAFGVRKNRGSQFWDIENVCNRYQDSQESMHPNLEISVILGNFCTRFRDLQQSGHPNLEISGILGNVRYRSRDLLKSGQPNWVIEVFRDFSENGCYRSRDLEKN